MLAIGAPIARQATPQEAPLAATPNRPTTMPSGATAPQAVHSARLQSRCPTNSAVASAAAITAPR